MSGRSTRLDPRTHAARGDIADVALAGSLFAPHYAVPVTRMCGWEVAAIHARPSDGSEQTSQLLPGEEFAILDVSGAWAWGYSMHDNYVGYVRATGLTELEQPSHVIDHPGAVMLAEPDVRAPFRAILPIGARVRGAARGDFVETARGFISARRLRPIDAPSADPVEVAERLIGMPYLWGGRGAGGIDCSGLVQLCHGLAGIDLPRDSDQQAEGGVPVPDGAPLRRGDLLFFPDHVAIAIDSHRVIHANSYWMAVAVEPIADLIARAGTPIARHRMRP